MRRFAELYQRLDRLTATNDKRAALMEYFRTAPASDAAWALWLLSGGKVGSAKAKIATSTELRTWISQASGVEPWLVEDCYEQVGDLAETIALLLDDPQERREDIGLAHWIEQRIAAVANRSEEERRALVTDAWHTLPFHERLVFNKLLTGSLRVGVSQGVVQQALAQISGVDLATIAQRMLGTWTPSTAFMERLLSLEAQPGDSASPFPFYLASPLEGDATQLGEINDWLFEWKWDGIRAQLIQRNDDIAVWSRGEERMDGRFPEIETALRALGRSAVIDGEILAWAEGEAEPLPFTRLQTRIQRKKPGPKTLADTPVRVIAYDLLELDGDDLREHPLSARRSALQALLEGNDRITLSPHISVASWEQAAALRDQARERGVEGLMLKRLDSPYRHGRKRGDWWKWKIDPLSIDAVLIYAQAGHGRRSTLYTDYTFGLWSGEQLVPVAKAYSGLDDAEILKLDRWIRTHTTERFGPVRAVEPYHVFELGFEAVNRSSRHKSGIAVRFPRILKWRHDKTPADADALDALRALAR